MEVGPWGCFIYSRVVQAGTALRVLMYPVMVSDSWAEEMTSLMTLMLTSILSLIVGGGTVALIVHDITDAFDVEKYRRIDSWWRVGSFDS